MKVENRIIINRTRDKVFSLVSDFEAWPNFIPTYKEVKIVEREGNKMVIERKGEVRGKPIFWRSEVFLSPPDLIKARQIKGPIPDMEIVWYFKEKENKTEIILIHKFRHKIPIIGDLIAGILVKKMAQETLKAIKRRIEEWKVTHQVFLGF
ncbi:MAG: SRPBCC family protein [bacterium]